MPPATATTARRQRGASAASTAPDAALTTVSLGARLSPDTPTVPTLATRLSRPDEFSALLDRVSGGAMHTTLCSYLRCSLDDWLRWQRVYATTEQISQLQRARAVGGASLAEETLGIADGPLVDSDDIARANLKITTRRWLAERLNRETFGAPSRDSKVDVNVSIGSLHLTALLAYAPSTRGDAAAQSDRLASAENVGAVITSGPAPTHTPSPAAVAAHALMAPPARTVDDLY